MLLALALAAGSLSGGASFSDMPLPDLVVYITGPPSARAGEPLGNKVTVTVDNVGDATAPGSESSDEGYVADIVLSSDAEVQVKESDFYATFVGYVQRLRGGRMNRTPDVAADDPDLVTIWNPEADHPGDLEIPYDTPSGNYFICAVVDPGRKVKEADESNNVACAPISIQGEPNPPSDPDETPSPSPRPTAAPASVSVPDLASPITRLKVDEDAPELDVELSPLLGDDYAGIDWAKIQSNDNPDLVSARVSRGEATFRFAKDRHGAAHVVIDGADLEGFLFTLVMFIDVEPTNDLPMVAVPMGEMQVQSGSGDIPLDLLQVFTDADLPHNHDRLTFRTSNDNPHLLSFSLQDSDLTLHPQPGKHGEANITVTATDQSGISASDTLRLVVEADDLATEPENEPENEIEEPSLQQKNGDSSSEKASTNVPSAAPTPSPDAASEEPESPESPESGDSPVDVVPATTPVPEPSEASGPNGNDAQVEAPTSPPTPGLGASQGIDSSKTDSPDTGPIVAGVDTPERDASEDEAHADAEVQQQTLKAPANASVSMVPEVAGTTSPAPLPPSPASAAPIPAPEPSPASGSASAQATPSNVASASAGTLPQPAPDTSSPSPATKVTLTAPNGDGPLSGRVLVVIIALMGVALAAVMALLVHIRRGHAT